MSKFLMMKLHPFNVISFTVATCIILKQRRGVMLRQCLRLHSIRLVRRVIFLRNPICRNGSSSSKSKGQRQPRLRSRLTTILQRPFVAAQALLDAHLLYGYWRRATRWLFAGFLFYHIFTSYFFAFGLCYGISMLPTINSSGDWVIISKYYRRGRGVSVGDLVSFHHPVDPGVDSVKRVLGLEGDFVLMDAPGTNGKMIQVPQGHCWVVGDNLKFSRDSRFFGPLPLALIKGKIITRYTPWTSLQWMRNGLQGISEDDSVD